MGAGKDTIADFLVRQGWIKLAFASPIKRICKDIYDFSDEQLYGTLEQKAAPDLRYPRPDGTFLSAREAMQVVGTECGRRLYPGTWSKRGIREANEYRDAGHNVVIPDCRFITEAFEVLAEGGQVWRVNREISDRVEATHQSEKEMDTAGFRALVTHFLNNNSEIWQLETLVTETLKITPFNTGC